MLSTWVFFFTYSRLNMAIGVMLIKKHVDRENKMQGIKNSAFYLVYVFC